MTPLRLLMLGTGPFAVPTFRQLLASEHQVLGLITRPPRPTHRHGKVVTDERNPMWQVAEEHGLPVSFPESINAPEAVTELRGFFADLLVVCDYGQILSPAALAAGRLGGINLHASLLPKYRGAAPINWAVYHGDAETGITVIHMTSLLDAGPCLAQVRTPIRADETTPELEVRLADLGAAAVLDVVAALAAGAVQPLVQNNAHVTRAPRLKKNDGRIDWSRAAHDLYNQFRALLPWPGTYTHWLRPEGEPLRVILNQIRVVPQSFPAPPGTVIEASGNRLVVAAGVDALLLERLQPAGKRVLSATEFLNGNLVQPGQNFGG